MKTIEMQRGFSMVEIMIVIGVISVILLLAVPSYSRAREDSRIKRADSELQLLASAIRQLTWDTGKYPNAASITSPGSTEIWVLTPNSCGLLGATSSYTGWKGPYIPSINTDPWGMNYFFDPDYPIKGVNRAVVGSFGPNKVGKNLYDSDDRYVIVD